MANEADAKRACSVGGVFQSHTLIPSEV